MSLINITVSIPQIRMRDLLMNNRVPYGVEFTAVLEEKLNIKIPITRSKFVNDYPDVFQLGIFILMILIPKIIYIICIKKMMYKIMCNFIYATIIIVVTHFCNNNFYCYYSIILCNLG